MEPIIWLVIVVLLLIVEIVTLGLTTIWFAGGALVSLIVSLLDGPLWLQVGLFILVSGLLLIFTRPLALKYFNSSRVRTNAEDLLGRHAIVTETVNNLEGTGRVKVNGLEWTARSSEESVSIEAGAKVRIMEIQGVKLICKKM